MNDAIGILQNALGIKKEQARVMTVISVSGGLSTVQDDNARLVVIGAYDIGSRLVVSGGIVQSVIHSTVHVFHVD